MSDLQVTPLPTFPEFTKKASSPAAPPVLTGGFSPSQIESALDIARKASGAISPISLNVQKLADMMSDPGFRYDDRQDRINLAEELRIAAGLPTPAGSAAASAKMDAQGAALRLQQLQGVGDAPHEQPLEQPNFPQLQLPDQPQTAQANVNPLAQLLAIGAGFASPQGAGQFNAAALEGALQGAKDENQRRQQVYKNEIAGRTLIYDAAMGQAKERQRITAANRDSAFQNTVADFSQKMLLAKAKGESLSADSVAESLAAFAKEHDPQFRALDNAKALTEKIKDARASNAERIKSATELLKAVGSLEAPGSRLTAQTFLESLKAMSAADVLDKEIAGRKAAATQSQGAARGLAAFVQSAETDRVERNNRANMSRLLIEENGRFKRQQTMLKGLRPPESLKQSQQNQARLQENLKQIEQAITATQADLDVLQVNHDVTVQGVTGAGGSIALRGKLNSLKASQAAFIKALQTEQKRGARFNPGSSGVSERVFDPTTGELVMP